MTKFPHEPFNWDLRWQNAGYLIERSATDIAVAALVEVGLAPHVEYRPDMPTDLLWWNSGLGDDQWERVRKAHALALRRGQRKMTDRKDCDG